MTAAADELQLRLGRSLKVNIFQDVAAIPPGTDWEQEIDTALAEFVVSYPDRYARFAGKRVVLRGSQALPRA